MANGNANNTHPITGKISGFVNQIFEFFKQNPIFAILSSLFLLGFILPPRSRKARRKSNNPGRRKKSPKKATGTLKIVGRKRLKKAGLINNPGKSRTTGTRKMPERFKDAKKGTQLMTEKMNWMRSKR